MPNPTIVEVNCETGVISERELTAEEMLDIEKANIENAKQKALQEAEAQAKAEAKASALAKLEALGLTAKEAAAIAGA